MFLHFGDFFLLVSSFFSKFVPMNRFEEITNIDYEKEALGSLQDIIASKFDNLPKDKRTKEYQIEKNIYNNIVSIYNKRAKHKIYNKIK